MRKLLQFCTLEDILESLDILPEIEIRMHESDDFRELEYISLSPVHGLQSDDIAVQLAGQSITHWDRWKVVETRSLE